MSMMLFLVPVAHISLMIMIELMKNLNRHKIETDSIYFDLPPPSIPWRLGFPMSASAVGVRARAYAARCALRFVMKNGMAHSIRSYIEFRRPTRSVSRLAFGDFRFYLCLSPVSSHDRRFWNRTFHFDSAKCRAREKERPGQGSTDTCRQLTASGSCI